VLPKPVQQPIDVWLGGIAPSELRRVGRLADGWIPSFVTPSDVAVGKLEVERVAAEFERDIDPEHFGALIPYAHGPLPDALMGALKARRPDLDDVGRLVPQGWSALVRTIEEFVAVGFSKFVVLPIVEPPSAAAWVDHLAEAAGHLMPLQT
jgi:alkanesulfonate monooxygenase SsuD/methylene tetrahydromethanopterin reductase-like flavin-dependent oxidoreductase (luciferase family)